MDTTGVCIHTSRLLHDCKGAPLAILIALVASRQPVKQVAIEAMTGYNTETVRVGLGTLEAMGYARRAAIQGGPLCWLPVPEAGLLPLFAGPAEDPPSSECRAEPSVEKLRPDDVEGAVNPRSDADNRPAGADGTAGSVDNFVDNPVDNFACHPVGTGCAAGRPGPCRASSVPTDDAASLEAASAGSPRPMDDREAGPLCPAGGEEAQSAWAGAENPRAGDGDGAENPRPMDAVGVGSLLAVADGAQSPRAGAENPRAGDGDGAENPRPGDANGAANPRSRGTPDSGGGSSISGGGGTDALINHLIKVKPPPPPCAREDAGNPRRADLGPLEGKDARPAPRDLDPPEPDDPLVDVLVDRTACPRARQVVGAALAEGYFRPWIEPHILRWTAGSVTHRADHNSSRP